MIVLDTNVLSELMRSSVDPALARWLSAQTDVALATTSVTVTEIAYGLARLPGGKRRAELEERFRSLVEEGDGLSVLPLDLEAATVAGRLRALRDELALPTSQADMMIAGICLCRKATLATRNTNDFQRVGLELIDPLSE